VGVAIAPVLVLVGILLGFFVPHWLDSGLVNNRWDWQEIVGPVVGGIVVFALLATTT